MSARSRTEPQGRPPLVLEGERARRAAVRLAAALRASRANHGFVDVRLAADHLEAARAPLALDPGTCLPTYETWARLAADWTVARERGAPTVARAKPRLGELDVALRSETRGGRRLHVTLDKVANDGRLLRLTADLEVERRVRDAALFEVLFPAADLPVELLLVRVLATAGVRAVEQVAIGAVDVFADVEVTPGPALGSPRLGLAGAPGAVALGLAHHICSTDITPGDNDCLGVADISRALAGEAAGVRDRLGTAALPQRLYRDRKLVANAAASPLLRERVAARGTRTVLYSLEAP